MQVQHPCIDLSEMCWSRVSQFMNDFTNFKGNLNRYKTPQ